jgi:hypothetical protein
MRELQRQMGQCRRVQLSSGAAGGRIAKPTGGVVRDEEVVGSNPRHPDCESALSAAYRQQFGSRTVQSATKDSRRGR